MTTETARRRVFLTGATGSMGLAAAKAMIEAGHEVVGVARSPEGADALRDLGATPVTVDLFDAAAVREAMRGADAVAHFATKVPEGFAMLKPGAWRMNDRLRTEGTRHLIAAAEANGIRRFIFESLALAYPDRGDEWIDESTALSPITPWVRTAIEAEAMLNEFGRGGGEPVNLRFPRIYGPGRASGTLIDSVRRRQMPIIGSGTNFVSSIHTDDVGTAVAAALTVAPGTYNVSDDEPLPQREYLQHAADALGAPPPRRMAYPVARMVLGKLAVMASVSQRVSSARFREAAGWEPRFRSAAEGWPDVVRRQEQALTAVAR